jgi:hypothetical protein
MNNNDENELNNHNNDSMLAGDKLDWSLEARRDEIVILVKKVETKSGKKKG